jgi:DNA mismatch repair protein PMS2
MASALHVLKREDVNRICSGQSVVDLATCVKELVENALDAGATQIDVKLREYGRDAIEVSDNGAGVAPANYASLALKHYTSKISAFEDIASVASFGFR